MGIDLRRLARCLLALGLLGALLGALPTPTVLAAPLVTNCADSGTGSLRAAIIAASSGDTITFQSGLNCTGAGLGPISLTGGTLTIGTNLTIDATRRDDRGGWEQRGDRLHREQQRDGGDQRADDPTWFHRGQWRRHQHDQRASLTRDECTISRQHRQSTAPPASSSTGTLTVTDSTIANNTGGNAGGGIDNLSGTVAGDEQHHHRQ